VSASYDVVVLGGGPAGVGAATALAQLQRTVVLFEPSGYDQPRAGETLSAEVRPLLAALGLGNRGVSTYLPFRGVRSAWGSPNLVGRDSIAHPLGDGWHVDRARFDEELARDAAAAGVSVRLRCGHCRVDRTSQGFALRPAEGEAAAGRFLIDASGRGAPASRAVLGESRWLQFDRLVALLGRMALPGSQTAEPELLVEAEQNGWWYSAPQPDGTLLVALMTDSDLPPARGRSGLTERWVSALACTTHTSARVEAGKLLGPVRPVRADSGFLLPDRGHRWRAIGDAAMGCDPLTGNGVVCALRSAISAAAEIHRALDAEEPFQADPPGAFAEYLDRRARYYLREGRWPSALFWARRRPPDWTRKALSLEPKATLRWDGTQSSPEELACVELLLPYRAIAKVLETLRTQRTAHEALEMLRDFAPLGDRRLLIALQLLVERVPIAVGTALAA
jgi:flavin-dependent dehydrogenase